jgi:hypothetical protein
MVRRYLSLILALAAIFLACHSLLPRLARLPGMDVVRGNLQSGVDATAYFYTELENSAGYERAASPGAERPRRAGDGAIEPVEPAE